MKRAGYFTTGEFAEAMGTTKDTLFHYDRIGLFSPEYLGENGYRYYSYRQFGMFSDIQILKGLGMELNEIKDYLLHRSPANYAGLLERQISRIREEISRLNGVLSDLEDADRLSKEALTADRTFKITEMDTKYGIRSRTKEEAFGRDFISYYERLKSAPVTTHDNFISAHISSALLEHGTEETEYIFSETEKLPLAQVEPVFPRGRYLIGYHFGTESSIPDTLSRMFTYLKANDLEPGYMCFLEYLVVDMMVLDHNDKITKLYLQIK